MTTQAITDIKELVGEMPARGCEFPRDGKSDNCGRKAVWIARVHDGRKVPDCVWLEIHLCGACLTEAQRNSRLWIGSTCLGCALNVKTVGDILGPVMPL